jgi:hypothetical protein
MNFDPKLGSKNGCSCWKYLDNPKIMVPSRRGIEIMEGRRNVNVPLFKMLLWGLGSLQSGIRVEGSNSRIEWVTKTN